MSTTNDLFAGASSVMRYASDVVLRNGATLRIRPLDAADIPTLAIFLASVEKNNFSRGFLPVDALAQSNPHSTFGLAGETGGEIVAIGHYFRNEQQPDRAIVAITIADGLAGRGIGTHLLEHLANVGHEFGVRTFEAEVPAKAHQILKVFLDSGFEVREIADGEGARLEMLVEPTESSESRSAERAREAAGASMRPIFEPRSIAVIGAGRRRGHLGAELFRNLIRNGFSGRLFPVNPNATEVEYVAAYPTVTAIPHEVDLAFIAVPADDVESAIDECIEKNVRAVVVLTGGFAETGPEGLRREVRLVEKIRAAGIRLVGPNAMGVINTDPRIHLHGTFSELAPPAGNVAMSTQSGALGLAILDYARSLNIGFSSMISVGNKADVSGNDLIQYWADDNRTEVILLYLESFGNPAKFTRIARRIARRKPIVAVKSGRSSGGAHAANRHTGARASSDVVVADLFRQSGIIRTGTLEEMFDVAMLLANQPLPAGGRVAILTNAGGPAVLAADACEANGLTLATLSSATIEELRTFLPPDATAENPVNITAAAPAERYWRAMEALLDDENVDSLIVIHIPVFPEDLPAVARGIREGAAAANGKTVVGTVMSARGFSDALAPLPCFPFPERAVAALALATNYSGWRRRPVGRTPKFEDIEIMKAKGIVERSLAAQKKWLSQEEGRELLSAAGIATVDAPVAQDPDHALKLASTLGYPVCLRALVSSLRRDVETAEVRPAIADPAALRSAWDELTASLRGRLRGIVVQKTQPEGADAQIGSTEQPIFGQLVYYGLAVGPYDVVPEVAFRFHPLTDNDAVDMTREAHSGAVFHHSALVNGGEKHIHDVLLRLSTLLELCPEIRELEIPSLRVTESSAVACEVHVRVGPQEINAASRRIAY